MRTPTPYEDRQVLRIVQAGNELGYTLDGDATLRGGWLEVNISGSPLDYDCLAFGWELVKKVNLDNQAIVGHHWMTDQFDVSREFYQVMTEGFARRLEPMRDCPGFRPMLRLTAEFRLEPGPLPARPPEPVAKPAGKID